MKVHTCMKPILMITKSTTIITTMAMIMMKKVMGTSMGKWMQICMGTVQVYAPYKFLRQVCYSFQ